MHPQDSRFRKEESLRYLCPDDPNLPYDMTEVIKKVVDEGNFFEVRRIERMNSPLLPSA